MTKERSSRMLNNSGFNLWADGYDKSVGISDEENVYPFARYKKVMNRIFGEVMEHGDAKVLDIGFGTATLAKRLYDNGCAIFGQDFSKRMIEIAKEKMPGAHLYMGDFSKGLCSELLEHKYDFIVSTYALHHLDDARKVDFINGLLPLLNDGGKILIGDVAFMTRSELEKCKNDAGNKWDDDEIYFVFDEIKGHFPKMCFEQISYCSGVLTLCNQ